MPNCFYFVLWPGLVGKSVQLMKNDHFLNIFISFGRFPQVFGQVNECLILELHVMIRVLHVVVCPFTSILFENRDWEGGVLKLTRSDYFFVFLAVWVLSPSFWTG